MFEHLLVFFKKHKVTKCVLGKLAEFLTSHWAWWREKSHCSESLSANIGLIISLQNHINLFLLY